MLKRQDAEYLEILWEPIRVCARYKPKFGQGKGTGLTLAQFQELYQGDPFYDWFGLGHPLMYAAHKAAGGMTSVYRQIGIGCQRLFQRILQDSLGLSEAAGKKAGTRLYAHHELDHEALFARAARLAGRFMMTYDYHEDIKALAARHGFAVSTVAMKNTHHARMKELLITNVHSH